MRRNLHLDVVVRMITKPYLAADVFILCPISDTWQVYRHFNLFQIISIVKSFGRLFFIKLICTVRQILMEYEIAAQTVKMDAQQQYGYKLSQR